MSNLLGIIGEEIEEKIGTRDAFHVPVVISQCDKEIKGGQWVRFFEYTKVIPCQKPLAHGISDPFCEKIPPNTLFYVLIRPGLVENIQHTFEIDLEKNELDILLEKIKREDPQCAECYVIENGEVVRY